MLDVRRRKIGGINAALKVEEGWMNLHFLLSDLGTC